jgi:phosphatidylethanolamine/phosphatidyl-N-methylethanolamine N-methyltransferase
MDTFGTLVTGIAALNAVGLLVTAFAERRAGQSPATPLPDTKMQPARLDRIRETFRFFGAWLRSPLRVAAIAPSSTALARLMTAEISGSTGPVIELGPGTGPFTRALLARSVREEDLALVEFGEPFARALSLAFPHAQTLCIDAAELDTVDLFGGRYAGAVVSGLPLLSMPEKKVEAILRSAFGKLSTDGAFYQFTYGPRCPVSLAVLERLGLKAERISGTFANLPPASVYRLRRAAAFVPQLPKAGN